MRDRHGFRLWACAYGPIAALLLLAALSFPASAHGQRSGPSGPTSGLSIPNLTHGQMAAIADNRGAIMDLAAQQFPTDPVMRRLEAFIKLQVFACAWGLVPGSVTNENSPFNECSHAYLAATRALLLHLQTMPGNGVGASGIVPKIELQMLQNDASLVLCQYSDESFNTADFIYPHLAGLSVDPINVGRLVGAAILSGWLAFVLVGWLRRKVNFPPEAAHPT